MGEKTVIQTLGLLVTQALDEAAYRIRSFLQREDGQDAFEYMLIVGGVSVTVVAAVVLLATQVPGIRSLTCSAIAGIAAYASFSC
jgi:Flp pilus assembly pilin Flp